MPVMSGYELARRLRALSPDRPQVFATVTAYRDHARPERAADAGFDLQFTEPADPARDLEDHIHRGAASAGRA